MVQVSGTPHQKPSYLGRPFSSINYWSTCSLRTNVNDKNDSKWVCFRKVEVFFGIKEQSSPSSHHHESTQALTSAPVPPVRNWKILEFRGTKMLAANRTTHKKTRNISCLVVQFFEMPSSWQTNTATSFHSTAKNDCPGTACATEGSESPSALWISLRSCRENRGKLLGKRDPAPSMGMYSTQKIVICTTRTCPDNSKELLRTTEKRHSF